MALYAQFWQSHGSPSLEFPDETDVEETCSEELVRDQSTLVISGLSDNRLLAFKKVYFQIHKGCITRKS